MAKHQTIRGAKIEERNGSYTVKLYSHTDDEGKRHYKRFTAPDKAELIQSATEWLTRKETASQPSRLTVKQAVEEYIATCETAGHSPTTIASYHKILRNSYPLIINKPLSKLTPIDIQRQINERAKTHSPKTISCEYGLLHTVLHAYAPSIDLSSIRLPSKKNKVSITDTTVIPSDDDVRALLSTALDDGDTGLYLAIILAALCGLRRSEIAALQWDDIDFDRQTVSITKALVKAADNSLKLKSPKSRESRRTLSISDTITQILRDNAAEGSVTNLTPDAITRRYERLRDRLGISGRFHDLRAYHTSTLVALKAPPEYIMADMGHSTMDLYRRVYTHMTGSAKTNMYSALAVTQDAILSPNSGRIVVASDDKNPHRDDK